MHDDLARSLITSEHHGVPSVVDKLVLYPLAFHKTRKDRGKCVFVLTTLAPWFEAEICPLFVVGVLSSVPSLLEDEMRRIMNDEDMGRTL